MSTDNQQIRAIFHALRYELGRFGLYLGQSELQAVMNGTNSHKIEAIRDTIQRSEMSDYRKAQFAFAIWESLAQSDASLTVSRQNLDKFYDVAAPVLYRFGLGIDKDFIATTISA